MEFDKRFTEELRRSSITLRAKGVADAVRVMESFFTVEWKELHAYVITLPKHELDELVAAKTQEAHDAVGSLMESNPAKATAYLNDLRELLHRLVGKINPLADSFVGTSVSM